jgi:hypothetical protein
VAPGIGADEESEANGCVIEEVSLAAVDQLRAHAEIVVKTFGGAFCFFSLY